MIWASEYRGADGVYMRRVWLGWPDVIQAGRRGHRVTPPLDPEWLACMAGLDLAPGHRVPGWDTDRVYWEREPPRQWRAEYTLPLPPDYLQYLFQE